LANSAQSGVKLAGCDGQERRLIHGCPRRESRYHHIGARPQNGDKIVPSERSIRRKEAINFKGTILPIVRKGRYGRAFVVPNLMGDMGSDAIEYGYIIVTTGKNNEKNIEALLLDPDSPRLEEIDRREKMEEIRELALEAIEALFANTADLFERLEETGIDEWSIEYAQNYANWAGKLKEKPLEQIA